jgi:hypothetical protein
MLVENDTSSGAEGCCIISCGGGNCCSLSCTDLKKAPIAPLTDLGTAGGTTPTADAAEDDKEDDLLLVADMVMLDVMEWVRWDVANDCAVEL